MNFDLLHLAVVGADRFSLAIIMALALMQMGLAPAWSLADEQRRARWLLMMVLVAVAVTLLELLMRTAAMADVPLGQAWSFVPRVLERSDYGFYWQWRAGIILLVLGGVLWSLWRGGSLLSAAWLMCGGLAWALLASVTSHAGEEGLWSLANLVNWAHIVSTSLWGGAVVIYAWLVLPALLREGPGRMGLLAERLSLLATAALVVVLLSGLYNGWRQMSAWSDLWASDYGLVLLVKLALVAVMMAIGAVNKFRWVPALVIACGGGADWRQPFGRLLGVLRIDSVVFVAVLIAAVVLGMQAPPGHFE